MSWILWRVKGSTSPTQWALSEVISVFAIDSGQTTGNPKSYPTETRVSPRASDFRDGICLESLRADMGGTP